MISWVQILYGAALSTVVAALALPLEAARSVLGLAVLAAAVAFLVDIYLY